MAEGRSDVIILILSPIALTTPYRSDNSELVSAFSVWLGDQEDVSEEEDVNNHLQCVREYRVIVIGLPVLVEPMCLVRVDTCTCIFVYQYCNH